MSPGHLRRWLVAIVMIASVAAAGAEQSEPSVPGPAGGHSGSAAGAAMASGWSGTEGMIPVEPQIRVTSTYERGVRVKLPVLVGVVAVASLAAAVVGRRGLRRHQSSRLPLALRAWSLRRRAPPLLPLG